MQEQTALGICIGASAVSYAILGSRRSDPPTERMTTAVVLSGSESHNGNPAPIVERLCREHIGQYPGGCRAAVTGRKFRDSLNLTPVSEVEAVELACAYTGLNAEIIISAGGENFIVYELDGKGKIRRVFSGNKCASGTGEFFMQQIKRMDLSASEASVLALRSEPYNISGRCSVFCKSDCTHALNKGVPKGEVAAGLARMMAQKIIELTSGLRSPKAALIGGTSQNEGMKRFLREAFPELIVPEDAAWFEALGAAVYALNYDTKPVDTDDLFAESHSEFSFHPPLKDFLDRVEFRSTLRGTAEDGDDCILGLDVGSTTTKAVVLRRKDDSILASEYLRTNGDPVGASIACYKSISEQITANIRISGLGVTGSGRHIAGLHALTHGIINEIIAHAAATVHFDPEADTIFEIGGQDAKYTYLTSGVASDYAMNEACSAGTGSFLEEAAKETLGVDYKAIGDMAMAAERPPNFNDQCAAFISSDIKNAAHEGLKKEDILAGLVYSVCQNYSNRVKGNRAAGKKIFMQGGVCYNKAVPVAMAAITGKQIIVPPEPGLMGAYGVALEIKHRLKHHLLEEQEFHLKELIKREVSYGRPFICRGGAEKCDRKCSISMIILDGKNHPFGGACNKYYNIQSAEKHHHDSEDLVKLREHLVFEKYAPTVPGISSDAGVIGITKSFYTNTLYPLYYNFFTRLGFRVVLSGEPSQKGIDKKQSSFCYPAELAHGFLQSLLDKKPDHIFLPRITGMYSEEEDCSAKTCVLMQSELYYLKSAFRDELKDYNILSPVLDFSKGYEEGKEKFIEMGISLGRSRRQASEAYEYAAGILKKMFNEFQEAGKLALKELEINKSRTAIVLFGRAYNAFSSEANLGIPRKFATRGVMIIPHDFLPIEGYESYKHMYWAMGKQILKAARFVSEHGQLFATFITNFSCGPDSFLIGYFRNIMGQKPSLTLELDSHSADAGINTRIEAALDIIKSYREITAKRNRRMENDEFLPVRLKGEVMITDSDGRELSIYDSRVKVIVPSMGRLGTGAFAAAFRYMGIRAEALPVYSAKTLVKGKGCSTCRECLPLQLNAGALMEYYNRRDDKDEVTLFFMAKGDGPCRLGQYHVFLEEMIVRQKLRNVAVYTLSDEDSYEGLGNSFVIRGWAAVVVSDVLKDMQNAIKALAEDKNRALEVFEEEFGKILHSLERESLKGLYAQLRRSALRLRELGRSERIQDAKKILLTGEIFVRHDEFSRMDIVERLSERGFVVRQSPIGEYIYYSNHLASNDSRSGIIQQLKFRIRNLVQRRIEHKIKSALQVSGFYEYEMTDVTELLRHGREYISDALEGEAVLTVGAAVQEIGHKVAGVIAVGPFGCMPSRVAESVLNVEMNLKGGDNNRENHSVKNPGERGRKGKIRKRQNISTGEADSRSTLPFLSIETDGGQFPQIIQSRLEIFMLQAERRHKKQQIGGRSK